MNVTFITGFADDIANQRFELQQDVNRSGT
jgi:hypothetical protein